MVHSFHLTDESRCSSLAGERVLGVTALHTTLASPHHPPSDGLLSVRLSVCLSVAEPFNASAYKGRQMMVGSTKSKTAYQTGYFGKTFDRVMEGEAYSDPVKQRRQDKLKEAKKNLSKAFVPSSISKKT